MGVQLGSASGSIVISTSDAQDSISGLADKLRNTGSMLSMGITAPLVGIATQAIKSAADFEQSFNVLESVSGATADQMKRMEQQALDLGATTTFSAGDAANGMLELSKAGMKAEDVMKAIPGVMHLAAAGELSVAQAAEVTSNALNAFHLPAEKAEHVANLFAAAANASSIEVTDMAQSMSQASAVAASYGQSIETTATAIAILGNNGIKGSDAGTSLKTMLSRLAAPTEEAAGLMKQMGVNVYDASGKMRPLPDILVDLQKGLHGTMTITEKNSGAMSANSKEAQHYATIIAQTQQKLRDYQTGVAGVAQSENDKVVAVDRLNRVLAAAQAEYTKLGGVQSKTITKTVQMTDETRNAALYTILGSDALRAGNILLKEGATGWDNMAAAVSNESAASDAANARMKGFSGAIEYLSGSIETFNIRVAKPFLATLSEYPIMLGDMITSLGNVTEPVRNMALGFLGVWAAAGPLMLAIAGVGTALGFLLSPIGLVILGTSLLAAAWASNFGGIRDKTMEVWAAISPTLTAWKDALLTALPGAMLTLQITAMNAWGAIQTAISAAWGIIQPLLNQLSTWLTTNLPTSLTTLQTSFDTSMGGVNTAIAGMKTAWDALVALFAPSVMRMVASLQPMIEGFAGLGGKFTALWTAAQPILNALGVALGATFAVLGVGSINLLASTFQALPTIVGAVIDQLTNAFNTITAVVQNMVAMVDSLIHGNWAAAWESAQAIVTTLQTYVSTTLFNLWTVISAIFSAIGSTIVNTLKDLGFEAAAASVQLVIDKVSSLSEWLGNLAKGELKKLGFEEPAWVTSMKAAFTGSPAWAAGLKKTADTIAANPAWIASLKAVTDVIKATPAWLATIKSIVDNWVKETDWVGILKDIVDTWVEAADWIATIQSIVDDWIKSPDWLATLKTQIENWFKVPEWITTLKTQIEDFFKVPEWIATLKDTIQSLLDWTPSSLLDRAKEAVGLKAIGDSYFGGGLTGLNERGRELISIPRDQAILPSGAQIYTAGQSNRMLAGADGGPNIQINNNNNVRSDVDIHRIAWQTASQIRFQAGR